MLHFKKDWELNPELPTLGPWHTVKPINTPTWMMERNPYLLRGRYRGQPASVFRQRRAVHAGREPGGGEPARDGRRIRHAGAPHRPAEAAGASWITGRTATTTSTSTWASTAPTSRSRSTTATRPIRKCAKWLTNADFRRALSLGIDRDQLNETFWLGLGTPGSAAPAEVMPQNPGPEWRKRWSTSIPPAPTRCWTRSA